MYCDNIYTSPLIYSASGAVVSKTIKGCPPKRANKIPPTDCEMITFWTSVKEWWMEQSTSKSSLKNVTCKSQSMTNFNVSDNINFMNHQMNWSVNVKTY